MTQSPLDKDIATLSFEEALKQLEEIVEKLEEGDVPLEESIATYERGEKLKNRCEVLLKSAEDKVEKIKLNREGQAESLEPFEDKKENDDLPF